MNDFLALSLWVPILAALWRLNLRNKGRDVNLVPLWIKWPYVFFTLEIWVAL